MELQSLLSNLKVSQKLPDVKYKNYEGTLHIVLVNQKGETFGHLVTQFPQTQNKPNAFQRGPYLWSTPKGSPIDSSQQAFLPKVKRGNFSPSESQETQSENSAETQEESSNKSEFNAKKDRLLIRTLKLLLLLW